MQRKLKRWTVVCTAVVFLLFMGAMANAGPNDISGHWAADEISKWFSKGLVKGRPDGTFKPDDPISRAEFITLVNRVFNYSEKLETPFPDVDESAWYYNEIAKAVAAGIVKGDDLGNIRPEAPLTRQEAAVILYRVFDVKVRNSNAAEVFNDADKIPLWSRDAISGLVENGYIKGRPDNTFAPTDNITRAEAVKMIDNIMGELKNEPGTYTENVSGNIVVNTSDITLSSMTVEGNLYITPGVGEGDVTLDNVIVKGETIVRGGGENSIVLSNTALEGRLIVIKKGGKIRIVAKGSTNVPNIELRSGALLQEEDLTGEGFEEVEVVDIAPGEQMTLEGDYENVVVQAPDVNLNIYEGSVGKLDIESEGANVTVGEGASVTTLNVNSRATISGQGTIETANVNANGVVIEQEPYTVNVIEGVTTEVGGDTITGRETSDSSPSRDREDSDGDGGSDSETQKTVSKIHTTSTLGAVEIVVTNTSASELESTISPQVEVEVKQGAVNTYIVTISDAEYSTNYTLTFGEGFIIEDGVVMTVSWPYPLQLSWLEDPSGEKYTGEQVNLNINVNTVDDVNISEDLKLVMVLEKKVQDVYQSVDEGDVTVTYESATINMSSSGTYYIPLSNVINSPATVNVEIVFNNSGNYRLEVYAVDS